MEIDVASLREALKTWQVYALTIQCVSFVVLSALNLPALLAHLSPPRWASRTALAAAVVGVCVVAGVAPQTHRIFYDEQIYEGVAQNLSDVGLAQMCNEGTVEYGRLQCRTGEYNKQTYGYPYVVSVFYRLFGVHHQIPHVLNTAALAAFVLLVFLVTGSLADWRAATFASVVAAIIPEHLIWSNTAASEPLAAVMILFSLLSAVWFTRTGTFLSLAWMTVTTVFAVQFKVECAFVVPVVGLIVLAYAPDAYRHRSLWFGVVAALALGSVHIAHLIAVRGETWGAPGDRMAWAFVWPNTVTNAAYYLDNSRFPFAASVLAIIGAAWKPGRFAVASAISFALFWGPYLGFYAGSYSYGADVRFALLSHAPVAMLAGLGAAALGQMAPRGIQPRWIDAGIASVLALQLVWFLPMIRAVGEEAWSSRADVAFAMEMSQRLGRQTMVLTHNPSMFHVKGVNAAQLDLVFADTPYVTSALRERYKGGVFIHWNYWCNVAGTEYPAMCLEALKRARTRLERQYRERDQRFAFYEIVGEVPTGEQLPLKLLVP